MPRDLEHPLGPNEFDELERGIAQGKELEKAINRSIRAGIPDEGRLEKAREARRKAEGIFREYFPGGVRPSS